MYVYMPMYTCSIVINIHHYIIINIYIHKINDNWNECIICVESLQLIVNSLLVSVLFNPKEGHRACSQWN